MMVRYEIKLGGFGGQGIALMGRIIGVAASIHEEPRKTSVFTQSYGPESRGGASSANVVVETEGKEIEFPYVQPKKVDIMCLMSKESYLTYLPKFLKDKGTVFIDPNLVKVEFDQDETLARANTVHMVPATALAEQKTGRRIVANIVMMGYISNKIGEVVSQEAIYKSTMANVPPKFRKLNEKAFEIGLKYIAKED